MKWCRFCLDRLIEFRCKAPGECAMTELTAELDIAERDAFKNLARYKFWMFGYFAARWVFLNHILKVKRPNPFKSLVNAARVQMAAYGHTT